MTESPWPMKPLGKNAEIRVSNVDKKLDPAEKPVRLCNYMHVYSNRYVTRFLEFMDASASESEIARFTLMRGDVVITKDSETPDDIGIPSVVVDDIENLVCGYHLALIRPDPDELDSVFLAKQLAMPRVARFFGQRAAGSTRYGLPTSAIENVTVPTPPKPEQETVSTILTILDDAIEKSKSVIFKLRRVKAGLVQHLLAYGVDEHGALRSPSTHKFKSSSLGSIPLEWSIGTLMDVTERDRQPILTGPFGADLGDADFTDDGVPVLRIGNVQAGRLDLSDLLYVSVEKAAKLQRYAVKAGDLLFARQGATTGRNALATSAVDGWLINYHIIRVALDHERCAPLFIEAAFASDSIRRQVDRDKGRGTREGINTGQLKALQLKLPPPEEQRRIASVLEATENQISCARQRLAILLHLNAGLMDDLLTGRKRVTPLLPATAELAVQA